VTEDIFRVLVKEEGIKLDPYRDHMGWWTIGIGHLIDRRKGGGLPPWVKPSFPITQTEAEEMCRDDIATMGVGLKNQLHWWENTSDVARSLLVLMAFQLGVGGVLVFKRMLEAVKGGDFDLAAKEMRDSAWWRVQTPQRAERMAQAMETQSLRGLL